VTYWNSKERRTIRSVGFMACAAALGMAFTVARPAAAQDRQLQVPQVPAGLEVPAGNELFLVGHAVGTQNYVCVPSANGFVWSLFTPQATLFDDSGRQIITHFFSPNPLENGTVHATWQDSRDTSRFFGAVRASATDITDPDFVQRGAISWLLLGQPGPNTEPTDPGRLRGTTFVQRIHTEDGVAPPEECASASQVGTRKFVNYKSDYFFYRKAADQDDNR
jgi:hypothetical protein